MARSLLTMSLWTMSTIVWALIYAAVYLPNASSFMIPTSRVAPFAPKTRVVCWAATDIENLDLKAELTSYMAKRKKENADEKGKKEVGKVVGGTKGNVVLEFVSGAPNKAYVIKDAPNIFDYDELTKYGFGYLVTPIMESGGRREMYNLMGLQPPATTYVKPKTAPKLIIDKTGKTDQARYTGLKMGQILDDDEMGRALEAAQKKSKEGKRMRPKISEEDYVMPFVDNPNISKGWTPDWTPEMLDEEGRKRGEAISWARKARAGEFVNDPAEFPAVEGSLRTYSVATALFVCFAFGRATPKALSMIGFDDTLSILGTLQIPALILGLVAVGSSVVAAAVLAPSKNRSQFTWFVKGLFGGPLAILQLQGLDELTTRGEQEQ